MCKTILEISQMKCVCIFVKLAKGLRFYIMKNFKSVYFIFIFIPHPRICLLILEREEGRERNINVKETLNCCLLHVPHFGNEPKT